MFLLIYFLISIFISSEMHMTMLLWLGCSLVPDPDVRNASHPPFPLCVMESFSDITGEAQL